MEYIINEIKQIDYEFIRVFDVEKSIQFRQEIEIFRYDPDN